MEFKIGDIVRVKQEVEPIVKDYIGIISEITGVDNCNSYQVLELKGIPMGFLDKELELIQTKYLIKKLLAERGD